MFYIIVVGGYSMRTCSCGSVQMYVFAKYKPCKRQKKATRKKLASLLKTVNLHHPLFELECGKKAANSLAFYKIFWLALNLLLRFFCQFLS
jgi:hypothetical protein